MDCSLTLIVNSINKSVNTITNEKIVKMSWCNQIINGFNETAIKMRDLVLTKNSNVRTQIEERQKEITKVVNSLVDSLKTSLQTDNEKQLFEKYMVARKNYIAVRQIVIDNQNAGNLEGAVNVITGDFTLAQEGYVNAILDLIKYESNEVDKLGDETESLANSTLMWAIILTLIGSIFALVISYIINRGISKPINETITAADNIAKGNMNIKLDISKQDETGMLMRAMKQMSESIQAMVNDANNLAVAAVNGKLDVRADANKYEGEFKNLITGLNNTLDAVINPLNVTAEYVDRISKGDIPPRITDDYKGDFNEIKNNLNQCIDAIELLIKDTRMLTTAAKDGEVDTRADGTKHQGDFGRIIEGINETLDLMLNPIAESVDVLKKMAEGNLRERVVGNYKGDHAVLKNALNQTLDSLPLKETMEVMKAMADGDLKVKMTGNYKGDSLELKNAINDTLDSLNEILFNVRTTVDEVTRGAMQVSDASTALSQGATEQAASLEEITSSMAEIGSQTRLNAENANQANSLTLEAREAAEKGNNEMGQLNDSMTEINESSKNISKIIKVIDEIAFQTNLLALNAAVEAARAGRHGKGFAVVAEEVRNLAARSATAAKETAELIENSMKTVERGSSLAVKTGEALEEIKNSSVKVADIVGEITTSSNEQAQGIAQINEGLTQIDKVTQTNTASAEESASASEELSGQANQLRELIDRFKLARTENYNIGYSPRTNKVSSGSSSRALPSRSQSYRNDDDLESMLDFDDNSHNSRANSNPHKMKAEDIIKLDEDDFGKY